jgi:hypothetical protein
LPGETSLMAASLKLWNMYRQYRRIWGYELAGWCLGVNIPTVLEARDDGADEATLGRCQFLS